MDLIRIKQLRLRTRIGWSDEERLQDQWVVIDIDLETDLSGAGGSDHLADTVDYHRAVVAVAELVRTTEAHLLEHLAERIADLLATFDGVRGITVEVTKEMPPIEENVGIAVRIERSVS